MNSLFLQYKKREFTRLTPNYGPALEFLMEFPFETIKYDRTLPVLPKHSGVYKIFDIHGKLIVLDKTSNLFERFVRYYGERSERVRDLDDGAKREAMIETGYAMPHWPRPWGRDASAVEQLVVEQEFAAAGIKRPAYGITGFSKDGKSVILDHRYDLWIVSLDGSGAAKDITGGAGTKTETRFPLASMCGGMNFVFFVMTRMSDAPAAVCFGPTNVPATAATSRTARRVRVVMERLRKVAAGLAPLDPAYVGIARTMKAQLPCRLT